MRETIDKLKKDLATNKENTRKHIQMMTKNQQREMQNCKEYYEKEVEKQLKQAENYYSRQLVERNDDDTKKRKVSNSSMMEVVEESVDDSGSI